MFVLLSAEFCLWLDGWVSGGLGEKFKFHIPDILASGLYNGRKWQCFMQMLQLTKFNKNVFQYVTNSKGLVGTTLTFG